MAGFRFGGAPRRTVFRGCDLPRMSMFSAILPRLRAGAAACLPALAAALLAAALAGASAGPAAANPKYAAIVVDGNTGAVLHASRADQRRYPASLTKMMTLYVVFEELKAGRLSLQTPVAISANAARQPASKLGLKAGESIPLEEAILALVVKSANDIATAVAEHVAGSEEEFARRMTRRAQRLGMGATRFANASGLPDKRQYTTARDMALLGRQIRLDFPEYYPYFSVSRFTFRGKRYRGHNRLVRSYEGADGIKTGYIRASGFNLVSSVERNGKRLVAVVMGGRTAKRRDDHSAALLNRYLPKASRVPHLHTDLPRGPLPSPLRLAQAAQAAQATQLPRNILALPPAEEPAPASAPAPVQAPANQANQVQKNTGAILAELIRRQGPAPEMPPQPQPPARPGSINLAVLLPSLIPPLPLPPERDDGDGGAHGENGRGAIGSAAGAPDELALDGDLHGDGWSIQLGAHPDHAGARQRLHQALARAPEPLRQARPVIQPLALGDGRSLYWSGFSGFQNLDRADTACSSLRRQQIWCVATSSPPPR